MATHNSGYMQREIKFRAWLKEKRIMATEFDIEGFFQNNRFPLEVASLGRLNPKEFILMQFTGLKDKNGKEIFEGDIVKCLVKGKKHNFVDKIIWDKEDVCFRLGGDFHFYEVTMEVIGNIYENPELLEKK